MAFDVFISYSTKNLHIVDWAVKTLHQQGHIHVFAAEYSVQPSQVLNQQIELAIRGCDLFILLWSEDARASDYVPQEIGIAKGSNKVILPVVMEEGVPGFISDLKYLPAHTTLLITPFEISRIRSLKRSATYTFPAESTATLTGSCNSAAVAGPLSPLKPAVPFPATVVITPLVTLRTQWLSASAI